VINIHRADDVGVRARMGVGESQQKPCPGLAIVEQIV
jgi:hypothetical protein